MINLDRMKKHKALLLFLAVFGIISFQSILAQSNYIFHQLKTSEGFSSTNVKTFLRDSYGFLWIGTESGLNRYDGYEFKVYTTSSKKPNSLISNDILGLQEDGMGNIWVNFGHDNAIYNRDKDCFITDITFLLNKLYIRADANCKIYVDKKKNLWVFNKKNIFFYDVKKRHTSIFTGVNIEDPFAVSVTDNGESVYCVENSQKCWQLNSNTGHIKTIKLPTHNRKNGIDDWHIIFLDSDNGLWTYFSNNPNEVYYRDYQTKKWSSTSLKSSIDSDINFVSSIIENKPGEIWIGTDHKGIFIFDKSKSSITNCIQTPNKDNSLPSSNITCMYRDNDGTIWIGHSKKGFSFFNESFKNFINFKHPEYSDISTIMEDHNEDLWIATDGKGLFKKNKKSGNTSRIPFPKAAITCLLEDRTNRIWIGTYQNGLFCWQNGVISQYTTKNSKLSNNNVWNLKQDRYGNIWIGSMGGKIQQLPSDATSFDSVISVFEDQVFALDMFYDSGDELLLGTGYGLFNIDITNNKNVISYGNKKGTQKFKHFQISTVYKDKHNILWIAHNDGLNVWDPKKDTIYYFNKSNGLCDNSVSGILEDNRNNIWVTTPNGLSVLTVSYDANDNLSISSKNYSVKDGLMDNYFNKHSILQLRNGDILLGNLDGYTIINPNKLLKENRPISKIIFTGLTLGNQTIEVDSIYNGHKLLQHSTELLSKLTLRHDDRLITLKFTSTDLLNADKVKYFYKIEGFNSEWIPIQDNKIVISALPAGSYKLLVKAYDNASGWNNNIKVLALNVLPPFYLTVWAYLFYGLTIAAIIWYTVRRSKIRHHLKLEEQREKMNREKEWHINEMKLNFFTNISHDLRTPLTLIITPLQVLLNDAMDEIMRKKINVIHKNAQQLLSLINSLLDFRKLDAGIVSLNLKASEFVSFAEDIFSSFNVYAAERNIQLSFESGIESLLMEFDKDKIQKTLTNLLSNAFKYTPDGGKIQVKISRDATQVCVKVRDTGSGISDNDKPLVFDRFYQGEQSQNETGSGLGLHIANEYIHLHGGAITIEDNIPHGCVFTFKIPIRESSEKNLMLSPATIDIPNIEEEKTESPAEQLVLFVDDNKDLCEFIEDNLKDDFTVLTAHNGQEAVELLQKHNITVIVSDVMMPVMDGIELCKLVKTNIYWSHIPVILLTARTAEEYHIDGLKYGADDYITKPFNIHILKLRINKFIEWTKKSHAAFKQKIDVNPQEITITSLDEIFIEKAIKAVEQHISDTEFSVENLGDTLGLSRGHLYKKLMFITGKGPAEFIRTIRLKRGRQLLDKSQLQVSQIAYEVGFNSPKRFSKYFREEFGLSPSEYLKLHKKL
jgi:signal transduction histidine kinase/ligand-binding sensor domain-containing protein/DNA-binding response OmpR family regulator